MSDPIPLSQSNAKGQHAINESFEGATNNLSGKFWENFDPNNTTISGALDFFLLMRDRRLVSVSQSLLHQHEFPAIVKGIYRRYNCLPIGWKGIIDKALDRNDPSFRWLVRTEIEYVTADTTRYPNPNFAIDFPSRNNQVERQVDEVLTNEYNFVNSFRQFMRLYVVQVAAAANGDLGPEAKRTIGITKAQVSYMFGEDLQNMIYASERLWYALDVIALVPDQTKRPEGRAGVLADIIFHRLEKYSKPYILYCNKFASCRRLLNVLKQRLPPSRERPVSSLNFNELWIEVSKCNTTFNKQSLETILAMPMRRLTNHKLWFEALERGVNEHAKPKVERTLESVYTLLQKQNELIAEKTAQFEMRVNTLLEDPIPV